MGTLTESQRLARNAYMRSWSARPQNAHKKKESHRKYRLAHLGKRAQELREWHRKNPKRHFLFAAKKRAKDKNLEFCITENDFELLDKCPVFGFSLVYGLKRQAYNSPTLDRIDSSKGYVPGNVMIISWRANDLKRDSSVEEMDAISAYMKRMANGAKG